MYSVDSEVDDQVDGLPDSARSAFESARETLARAPWSGEPANSANPDGQTRFLPLRTSDGSGLVIYVIVDHARQVVILDVIWASLGDRR